MVTETMEANKVLPLRHSSLPGLVRLPHRYRSIAHEQENRKGSICAEVHNGMSDRLEDMGQALLWIKQELVYIQLINNR